jgi:hypothetical protein
VSLSIEPDEQAEIVALGETFGALNAVMQGGGTPAAVRMCIASLRRSADLLEQIIDRWEGQS